LFGEKNNKYTGNWSLADALDKATRANFWKTTNPIKKLKLGTIGEVILFGTILGEMLAQAKQRTRLKTVFPLFAEKLSRGRMKFL